MPSRRVTLAVVLLGGLAASATITILTIAVPAIARDLGAEVSDTAWVLLAPIVVSALVSPASGRAADVVGRKRMWILGQGVALAGVIGSGLAPSLPVLIGARVATGAGIALAHPAGLAIAVAEYEPAEQGTPIGWWTSTTALSPAAGVLAGGLALEYLSWRWLFWGQIPFVLGALAFGWVVFREQRAEGAPRFDAAGAIAGGAVVFALLLAVNRGDEWGWLSWPTLALFGVVVIGAPVFALVERRAAHPIVPLPLLRRSVIGLAVLNRAFVHAAYMGSFIVIPVLFMEVGGWGAAAVALALLPRPVALGVTGPIAGALTRRLRPSSLVVAGSLALVGGTSLLTILTPSTPYPVLFLALICMGVGLGTCGTASGQMVTSRAEADELGTVSGFLGVVGSVSNSLGMAVMISALAIAGGETELGAYHVSFAVAAAFAALALIVSLPLASAARADRTARGGRPRLLSGR